MRGREPAPWTANIVVFVSPSQRRRIKEACEKIHGDLSLSECCRKVLLRWAEEVLGRDEEEG